MDRRAAESSHFRDGGCGSNCKDEMELPVVSVSDPELAKNFDFDVQSDSFCLGDVKVNNEVVKGDLICLGKRVIAWVRAVKLDDYGGCENLSANGTGFDEANSGGYSITIGGGYSEAIGGAYSEAKINNCVIAEKILHNDEYGHENGNIPAKSNHLDVDELLRIVNRGEEEIMCCRLYKDAIRKSCKVTCYHLCRVSMESAKEEFDGKRS